MTDTQQVNMAAVLEKIALMKELQERAGTPGEAAAAAAGIQRLMFKYNISEIEVRQAKRDESEGFEREDYNLHSRDSWRAYLMNYIAEFNFCRMVYRNGMKKGNIAILVGKEHNIIVTKNLYEYLSDELVRLADIAWKEEVKGAKLKQHSYTSGPSLNARSFKHAFFHGATQEIYQRLKRQRQESMEEAGTSSALVVVEEEALNDAIKQMFGRLRSGSNVTINDARGYGRGKEAGRSVNLVDQIGA